MIFSVFDIIGSIFFPSDIPIGFKCPFFSEYDIFVSCRIVDMANLSSSKDVLVQINIRASNGTDRIAIKQVAGRVSIFIEWP